MVCPLPVFCWMLPQPPHSQSRPQDPAPSPELWSLHSCFHNWGWPADMALRLAGEARPGAFRARPRKEGGGFMACPRPLFVKGAPGLHDSSEAQRAQVSGPAASAPQPSVPGARDPTGRLPTLPAARLSLLRHPSQTSSCWVFLSLVKAPSFICLFSFSPSLPSSFSPTLFLFSCLFFFFFCLLFCVPRQPIE